MSSQCEICGKCPENREINTCCWKVVCSDHSSEICQLCNKKRTRFPYLKSFCERCSVNSIKFFCETCKVFLCSDCNETVHFKGKYKNHSVKTSDASFSLVCGGHFLPFTHFCSLCGFCCMSCRCPHNKQLLKETEKVSKALQEKYLKLLDEKMNFLRTMQKNLHSKFSKTLEFLENSKVEAQSEFEDLLLKIKKKKEENLSFFSNLIENYTVSSTATLMNLSSDLNRVSELYSLFSIPLPMHALILSIPEQDLQKVTEKKDYKLPEVNLNPENFLNNDMNTSFSFNSILPVLDQEKPETLKSVSPGPLQSKENFHKRLDSQDLPPRPSSGRPSVLRQTSGKSLSCDRSPGEDQILKDSLSKRNFLKSAQSSSSIKLSWTHPMIVAENLEYLLEWSQDMKEFKQVYRGKPRTCIITDLAPGSCFYFKVCPVVGEVKGEISDVLEVSTFEVQSIDLRNALGFASVCGEYIEFKSNGTVFSLFPYLFGKHYWEVAIRSTGQSSGFIKIGVAGQDKKSIIGRSILYSKSESIIRVMLDLDKGVLVFFDSSLEEEHAQKIPQDQRLYSAIQVKSSKTCSISLWIKIVFHNDYT